MADDPKPTRGMPRSLIYVMIPAGFIVIVLVLMLSGALRQEEVGPPEVVEEPPAPVAD
jgi:TRAP-type C4-dicarboxylate transport system permease small subunit